jgi:hypothetical protein
VDRGDRSECGVLGTEGSTVALKRTAPVNLLINQQEKNSAAVASLNGIEQDALIVLFKV